MSARDKAAELYQMDGSDPSLIIALRSAFRAGADWKTDEARAVIRDMDIARAHGTVYTYGQVQERLRVLLSDR